MRRSGCVAIRILVTRYRVKALCVQNLGCSARGPFSNLGLNIALHR